MKPQRIFSKAEARNTVINAQLLSNAQPSSLTTIQHLGYVQIDTLAVAERAHHHVLHTRNTDYNQQELAEMIQGKQVFEYWSHAASFLPMEDYRYSLVRKKEYARGKSHWFKHDKKMLEYVLKRIREEGPLQSKDFKDPRNSPRAWYDWKPAKIALEQLFMAGKLMVTDRINFQKSYDLTERALPQDVDTSMPTREEFCEYLIKRTLSALGLAALPEITYQRSGVRPAVEKVMKKMIRTGEVMPVRIDGLDQLYYALTHRPEPIVNTELHILSPFDNLIIQRKRTKTLFDFDYQLECYVPEKKRKFGYYCLPILYKDRFVGRFDPKADRKTGIFTIKSLWLEPGFTPGDDFFQKLTEKLKSFIAFCGCRELELITQSGSAIPPDLQLWVNKSGKLPAV